MTVKNPSAPYRVIALLVRVFFVAEGLIHLALGLFTASDGGLRFSLDGGALADAALALSGLALSFLPETIERLLRIRLSAPLKIAIVLFIFGAQGLGEIHDFYERLSWWDVMLHTTSGVVLALIGFLLVDLFFGRGRRLTPFSAAFFAFCFALAAGAVWELIEYGGDRLIGMNMQKYLPVEGVTLEQAADGMTRLTYPTGGAWTFDAGLIDTMDDILCDTLAALATSVVGFFRRRSAAARANAEDGAVPPNDAPPVPATVSPDQTAPCEPSPTAEAEVLPR